MVGATVAAGEADSLVLLSLEQAAAEMESVRINADNASFLYIWYTPLSIGWR
ncbi:hypothetical protein D3C73_1659520 [compost metagenome]